MNNSSKILGTYSAAGNPFARRATPTRWERLDFGKYRNKNWTLPQLLVHDPDCFFWYCDNRAFDHNPALRRQAQILDTRATSIRIPQRGPERCVVNYNFYSDGSCTGFDILPESRLLRQGYRITAQDLYIDMSVPYMARHYDKKGNRLFLRSLKFHLFGDSSFPMTKKRCEAFFDNDKNFHLNDLPDSDNSPE